MKRISSHTCAALILLASLLPTSIAHSDGDVKPNGKLLAVATAHLDTQWRWTIQNTINEYMPNTLHDNFKLMQLYPKYVFSFEGAFRYGLVKEYYPEDFETLKKYIASGQWRVAGSWVDAVDVNIPSFESLVRHSLYGNGFHKKNFGKQSRDIFLPDCFGFGFALPSIAHHCGLKSFSTQKLTWGSAKGTPFDIGRWVGVDGSSVIAAIRPGSYGTQITGDLSRDTMWTRVINHQRDTSGLAAAYMYFGTGDVGGSPDSLSVDWLSKSMNSDGPISVITGGSDDLVELVSSVDQSQLPTYQGELLMTRHGIGCYTSQSAMKRWNRKNELLADAAERASVIANVTSGKAYPNEVFEDLWMRFLWHQFHDDVTGTSIPEAYEFSWNDEILCQNRFASLLENAVEATTPLLNTNVKGTPVVLYNPLAMERTETVVACLSFPKKAPLNARVYDPSGKETVSQILARTQDSLTIAFTATVPSVGYAVYDVREAPNGSKLKTELIVSDRTLENSRYKVTINNSGDIASVFDKLLGKELLTAPVQYQLLFDKPKRWPSWELEFDDIMAAPRATVGGTPKIGVTENGPSRIAISIERSSGASLFKTTVRLAAGSDQIEVLNSVDWKEKETVLKVAFPLASANDSVTYDLGLGAIKRGLNKKEHYEVPGQQWADMSSPSGDFGVSILNDCKYGWDHPDAGTLRLTLIHTPGVYESWNWVGDQKSMDLGHHEFTFAISGHAGDFSKSGVVWQGARLNQPIRTFQTPKHGGNANTYSLVSVSHEGAAGSTPSCFVNAIKKAEASDEMIIRVRETNGMTVSNARLHFASPLASAREVNGSEDSVGAATIDKGDLLVSLTPYQPKAFAVRFAALLRQSVVANSSPITLSFDLDALSKDADRKDGNLDGLGNTLPAELLPASTVIDGVTFNFGTGEPGKSNAVSCSGQTITIPEGKHNRLYLVLTSVGGPTNGWFKIGDALQERWIQDYVEPIAQWNNRLVSGNLVEEPDGIAPAYINREKVAWYGSHRHTADGNNEAYRFTFLYMERFNLAPGVKTFTLPNNPHIKLFAATVASTPYDNIATTQPLYDVRKATLVRMKADSSNFIGGATVTMSCPIPGAEIHYTLDGTVPVSSSPAYTGPVSVSKTTTVKARALLSGTDDSFVTSVTYHQLVPHPAESVDNLVPGLQARYFEGEWFKLPDFDTIPAKQEFLQDSIALPPFVRHEDFGLDFKGYFFAPSDGMYEFILSSDDGSRLYIGDSLVVENDGLHGSGDVTGNIALKEGIHRLYVPMFQSKGDLDLKMWVVGPNLPRTALNGKLAFHAQPKKQ